MYIKTFISDSFSGNVIFYDLTLLEEDIINDILEDLED